MTNEDLSDMMHGVEKIGIPLRDKLKDLEAIMDLCYKVIAKHQICDPLPIPSHDDAVTTQKVAINEHGVDGVNETSIMDLITLYVGDMKVAVDLIRKYDQGVQTTCKKIEVNHYSFKPKTPLIDDFDQFEAGLLVTVEALKDFHPKMWQFYHDLDKYLQTNRVINLDNEMLVVNEYSAVISAFTAKYFTSGYHFPDILEIIRNRIIEYSRKHPSF